jgi:hypothetical protein
MITSTVNKHLLVQIRMMKGAYGTPKYKRHNRRVNFLLRINQSHGGDHRLTMGEIDSRRINPLTDMGLGRNTHSRLIDPRARMSRHETGKRRAYRQYQADE